MPTVAKYPEFPVVDTVYTDSGVFGRNPSQVGISWAFCFVAGGQRTHECSGMVLKEEYPSLPYVSNNFGEFVAVLLALEGVPTDCELEVCTDSEMALQAFTNPRRQNWVPDDLWDRRLKVMGGLWGASFKLLGGHPRRCDFERNDGVLTRNGLPWSEHNVHCDAMCTAEIVKHRISLLPEDQRCNVTSKGLPKKPRTPRTRLSTRASGTTVSSSSSSTPSSSPSQRDSCSPEYCI